ncbi:MAG: rhomboid family intramembrane serine protease [Gammaproteobacteria bacterium]|nr:rhomboid family intramembrane serine protease [Gammaproteobacteria bacterium]MBV8403799.1 rhomboid family intramembrane serine protease [Gammaproteobacteria bacterium]
MPRATRTLILINVAVFLLEQVDPGDLLRLFALWPLHSGAFRVWQLVTYSFLHDPRNLTHIFFNMFALYMFGRSLEQYWGARRFVIYYLVCVVAAALTQLAVQQVGGVQEETLGASGGIFGVLLAFAWYFPRQRLFIIPIPIPIPAWLFVTVYALVELFFGVTGREQGVAHFAHLGGLLGGALCILYWRARRRFAS